MTTISVSHHDFTISETADGKIRVSLFKPDVNLAIALEMTINEAFAHGSRLSHAALATATRHNTTNTLDFDRLDPEANL
jgi:PhoPQ-activated pathogenicity-related protein